MQRWSPPPPKKRNPKCTSHVFLNNLRHSQTSSPVQCAMSGRGYYSNCCKHSCAIKGPVPNGKALNNYAAEKQTISPHLKRSSRTLFRRPSSPSPSHPKNLLSLVSRGACDTKCVCPVSTTHTHTHARARAKKKDQQSC